MSVAPDAPAPAPSAEARRLILEVMDTSHFCGDHRDDDDSPYGDLLAKAEAADRALSAYVAGLEADAIVPDDVIALSDAVTQGDWFATDSRDDSEPTLQGDYDDETEGSWTVSTDRSRTGWSTDGGMGYGINEANARFMEVAVRRLRAQIAAQRGRAAEGGEP